MRQLELLPYPDIRCKFCGHTALVRVVKAPDDWYYACLHTAGNAFKLGMKIVTLGTHTEIKTIKQLNEILSRRTE